MASTGSPLRLAHGWTLVRGPSLSARLCANSAGPALRGAASALFPGILCPNQGRNLMGARTLNRKTTLAWRVLLGIEWPEGRAANCPSGYDGRKT